MDWIPRAMGGFFVTTAVNFHVSYDVGSSLPCWMTVSFSIDPYYKVHYISNSGDKDYGVASEDSDNRPRSKGGSTSCLPRSRNCISCVPRWLPKVYQLRPAVRKELYQLRPELSFANMTSCVPRLVRNCISCIESYGCTKCPTIGRFLQFYCEGDAIPLQAWSGPEGSRKLGFSDFMTKVQDGGKVVSLTHRPPLPPRKYSWYSFMLEAESTPGPQCDRKVYVNEKFQWNHLGSNQRPSDLYHSTLITVLPRPPQFYCTLLYTQLYAHMKNCWMISTTQLLYHVLV